MFQKKVAGKIETRILYSTTFFFLFPPLKSYRLRDNDEKYCRAGQATENNMAHAHCVLKSITSLDGVLPHIILQLLTIALI